MASRKTKRKQLAPKSDQDGDDDQTGVGKNKLSKNHSDEEGNWNENGMVDIPSTSKKQPMGGEWEESLMSPVKQATLISYHLAIEDSVDIDKIWDKMQLVFDDEEQEDIQIQGNKKAEMRKLLDLLPQKDDDAFDTLVNALRPEYKWLAVRLQEGVKDEEQRVKRMGKGIRRKIAIALLTARISERQKDGILDRVTSVMETEILHRSNRVSIPDHRASAQLDTEHATLHDLIRNEVDPLLYGEEPASTRDSVDYDDVIDVLRGKLEQLQILKECYSAVNIGESHSVSLPSLLLEKIEEVKTKIKILKHEKQEALADTARLSQEKEEQLRALSRLQQHNRNLELENRTLESDRQWLEQAVRKNKDGMCTAEKDYQRVAEENRNLKSEIQQVTDRLSNLTLRNRNLDDQNTKLTRDNFRLSNANTKFRKDSRNKGANVVAGMRWENKRLMSDRTQLKTELQRMEAERRHLVIRSRKLEAENGNLREQKRKLLSEKRRNRDENKALKREAKRLAIGKYSPLPPINEDREREDRTSHSRESESRRPVRRVARSTGDYYSRRPRTKTETPWNKYKDEDKSTLPKGKPSTSREKNKAEEEEEGENEGQRKPGYMKSTTSSTKHHYLEEEVRGGKSPRRSAAWK